MVTDMDADHRRACRQVHGDHRCVTSRRFKKPAGGVEAHFESLPIRTKLTDEEVAQVCTAQRFRFPGVDIKARLFRNYPLW